MSIKSKLLEEIQIKAQKIRDKRIQAANNKTIEDAVFEFFKNIEESRQLHGGSEYDRVLFENAKSALLERMKGFDNRVKLSVEFSINPDTHAPSSDDLIRGVTIWWSQSYIKKNNVDPSLYIDVGQMLFI